MQTYLTENVSVTLSFLSPLSRRSRRLSSSIPPNTLKFEMICFEGERWYTWKRLRLHTWVFSYFPKERLVTIAGLSSLSTRYCGGLFVSEDHLKAEYLSIFIDTHGNICLDILKEKWSALYEVRTILLSIQSLLGK